jgi:hypothetical protein
MAPSLHSQLLDSKCRHPHVTPVNISFDSDISVRDDEMTRE